MEAMGELSREQWHKSYAFYLKSYDLAAKRMRPDQLEAYRSKFQAWMAHYTAKYGLPPGHSTVEGSLSALECSSGDAAPSPDARDPVDAPTQAQGGMPLLPSGKPPPLPPGMPPLSGGMSASMGPLPQGDMPPLPSGMPLQPPQPPGVQPEMPASTQPGMPPVMLPPLPPPPRMLPSALGTQPIMPPEPLPPGMPPAVPSGMQVGTEMPPAPLPPDMASPGVASVVEPPAEEPMKWEHPQWYQYFYALFYKHLYAFTKQLKHCDEAAHNAAQKYSQQAASQYAVLYMTKYRRPERTADNKAEDESGAVDDPVGRMLPVSYALFVVVGMSCAAPGTNRPWADAVGVLVVSVCLALKTTSK